MKITTLTLLFVAGLTVSHITTSCTNAHATATAIKMNKAGSAKADNKATASLTNKASEIKDLEPKQFKEEYEKNKTNSILLDVRRPDEYQSGHLSGAKLINIMDDKFMEEAQKLDKKKTLYIYCRSGRRSMKAAEMLSGKGYTCVNMKGGVIAWEKEGFALEK